MNTRDPRHDNPHTIGTFGDGCFDLANPDPADITLPAVAHSLARITRYTGHTTCADLYNVAHHSVLVHDYITWHLPGCPDLVKLAGLLHDGPEYAIGDVSRPLKAMLPDYRAVEATIENAFEARFGLGIARFHPVIKQADRFVYAWERRDIAVHPGANDAPDVPLPKAVIVPWSIAESEAAFLERAHRYTR